MSNLPSLAGAEPDTDPFVQRCIISIDCMNQSHTMLLSLWMQWPIRDESSLICQCSLSSFQETSRRILSYGNSFLPTFPEVLLAHASQMTGQLSRSMHIACKYWQAERQYKMRCTRQLCQNLLLHFAEQPRFMAYKYYSSQLRFAHQRAVLCMAAPLQRSGEYDVFLKMSPSALYQRWTWTLVMSSCQLMSAFLSPIEPAGQDISPASHVPLPWRSGEPSADTGAKGSYVAADAARPTV